MSGSFGQDKGKRAEREVVRLLQPVVTKVCQELGYLEAEIPMLERNLMQSHKGGHDIVGLEWLALEVKHHETLNVSAWWKQTVEQANRVSNQSRNIIEPVLFYKQNRVKWRVRMIGFLPVGDLKIKSVVEISLEAFLVYFEYRVRQEMMK